MKRIRSIILSLALINLMLNLCGCANVSRLEEQAIISAIGIDVGENARFSVTVCVFQSMGAGSANPIDPSKSNTVTAHAEADTINDAMNELRLILGRQVNTGHTKYIILGSELIKKPLGDALGYFIANEQTYLGTPLLTTNKKAKDILKVQLLNDVETAIAVENIIDTAIQNGSALKTDLLMAANALTEKSPLALPIITVKQPPEAEEKNSDSSGSQSSSDSSGSEASEEPKILFEGTAVSDTQGSFFKLSKEQTLGLSFLTGSLDFYEMPVFIGKDSYSVSVSLVNHTKNLQIRDGSFVLCFEVECMVRIIESSQADVKFEKVTDEVQRLLNEVCTKAIYRLKEYRYGDIIGVKKQAMSLYPFGEINYDNIFTGCEVVVNVNVHSDR